MSDITVIGLGLMGAALARALRRAGHEVTIWNRSPGRMEPFAASEFGKAADAASAVAASPVILICIADYAATDSLLGQGPVAAALAGRTVVQLSTGTPKEARQAAVAMAAAGARYLDGAILEGPDEIGTDSGEILLAGDPAAWLVAEPLLSCLAGKVRYLGATVGAAAALDLAWLMVSYGQFIAIAHAATMCRAEGVGLDAFIDLLPDDRIRGYAQVIHAGAYHDRTATLAVWSAALARVQQQAADAGISAEVPDFITGFFRKAIDAGYGEENVMALYKVLAARS